MIQPELFRQGLSTLERLSCIYNNLRQAPPPITPELYSSIQTLEQTIAPLLNHIATEVKQGQIS